jgi:hypothetical protein
MLQLPFLLKNIINTISSGYLDRPGDKMELDKEELNWQDNI